MEMLILGARVLTVGRSAGVKALADPFLIVVVASVRLRGFLTSVGGGKNGLVLVRIHCLTCKLTRQRMRIRPIYNEWHVQTRDTHPPRKLLLNLLIDHYRHLGNNMNRKTICLSLKKY